MEQRRSEAGAALFAGVVAAGLGLGFLAVLVLLLWISSPYPDSGPGGALHVVADLWLLAHGAELVRLDTRGGLPAPVGLVPLLLTAMPAYLLYRAARDALTPQDGWPRPSPYVTGGWLAAGYLAVAAGAGAYAAADGALRVSLSPALLRVPLTVGLATAAGVGAAEVAQRRRPGRRQPTTRDRLDPAYAFTGERPWLAAAARSAAVAAGVLLAGGLVLAIGSLAGHAALAKESFVRLTAVLSGRLAVLLLVVVLLPNAAVWAAAYGMGPGFAAGTGHAVGPLGSAGSGAAPFFPLLAAIPEKGAGTPLTWASAAVPAVAGLLAGWYAGRAAAPVRAVREPGWTPSVTAGAAALAALACGGLFALLAALAGGPLGRAGLAEFGPVWWQAGGGTVVWLGVLAVPTALAVRAWRLRGAERADGAEPSPPVESAFVESPLVESPLVESPLVESPLVESPLVESPFVESSLVESPLTEPPLRESPLVESAIAEPDLYPATLAEPAAAEEPLAKPAPDDT